MAQLLTVGVIGKSFKENEKRVAIHPEHIELIPKKFRKQITFEEGYGERFGMDDEAIAKLKTGRVASRKEILNGFDCVVLPKPLATDLSDIREGAIVWGWPHCVQQKEITQVAIDKKLTLIAWEEMFTWNQTGNKTMHTFYKNNELAGYAGVNHAISLVGVVGNYGKPRKAVVLSFGSVSRGAVYALQGQGFSDITVYTSRKATNVSNQLPGIKYKQMKNDGSGNLLSVGFDGNSRPFSEVLSDVQIIVNGTLQNTDRPKMFVSEQNERKLMKGTLIVDISCDEGMGFWCAKPTSFEHPMFEASGKYYYAVDHSPSFYWNSASWEISKALLPFIPKVIEGPNMWKENKTISNSIEIFNGVIQNPKILSFQNREEEYPHKLKK
ncbi:N(5)-(carboxyethyl)ornithine synthase [Candidatus Albibeggiatoa sp. nov. BB20]|uniref:N(5)-(carboxyethyl)ornithine synthase n=1 Tax=Candidatus Albibeggiatoa sp. nov. BB20 TaxID=3162723 RepID=UPI00336544B4